MIGRVGYGAIIRKQKNLQTASGLARTSSAAVSSFLSRPYSEAAAATAPPDDDASTISNVRVSCSSLGSSVWTILRHVLALSCGFSR